MLALCSMLSGTYYAQNYASIIGGSLPVRHCLQVSYTRKKTLLTLQISKHSLHAVPKRQSPQNGCNDISDNKCTQPLLILLLFYVGKSYYGIRIVTGHQVACSATPKDVFFYVQSGKNIKTEKISIKALFDRKSFHKGTYDDMIIETDGCLEDILEVGVGLKYDLIVKIVDDLIMCHWYVCHIDTYYFKDNTMYHQNHFPCYHWLGYTGTAVTTVAITGEEICETKLCCIL